MFVSCQICLQSVSSEQKVNALAASFIHMPVGENIDWRLSATISPCYVTVINRFLASKISFYHSLSATISSFKVTFVFKRIVVWLQFCLSLDSSGAYFFFPFFPFFL